ncbi:MAG: pectin acetylesterase-family hydrolase [Bacteroidota bacterium]
MLLRAFQASLCVLALTVLAACDTSIDAPVAELAPTAAGVFDDAPYVPTAYARSSEWTWLDAPRSMCRDGSSSGVGVRAVPGSTKLLFLMQGGGACLDPGSCETNPSKFDETDFNSLFAFIGNAGVFDRSRADNPFADWNMVFIPYCTGDVHSGSNPNGFVPGVEGVQRFVGYDNLQTYLGRLGERLDRADQIVLSGVSAGGFGTVGTYELFAEAFAPRPVDVLNDSGPLLRDDAAYSPELQLFQRFLWNLEPSIPDGCTDCNQPNGDGIDKVLTYYANTYPDANFGLLSYEQDSVIRFFNGSVLPTCTPENPLGCLIPGQTFEDALYDLREILPENVGTYYVPGEAHTFLLGEQFYTTSVDGLPLTRAVQRFLEGKTLGVPPTP